STSYFRRRSESRVSSHLDGRSLHHQLVSSYYTSLEDCSGNISFVTDVESSRRGSSVGSSRRDARNDRQEFLRTRSETDVVRAGEDRTSIVEISIVCVDRHKALTSEWVLSFIVHEDTDRTSEVSSHARTSRKVYLEVSHEDGFAESFELERTESSIRRTRLDTSCLRRRSLRQHERTTF